METGNTPHYFLTYDDGQRVREFLSRYLREDLVPRVDGEDSMLDMNEPELADKIRKDIDEILALTKVLAPEAKPFELADVERIIEMPAAVREALTQEQEGERRLWWGYLHINGHIHLKRFWPSGAVSRSVLEDADQSPFVKGVVEPFAAPNSIEAEKKIRRIVEFVLLDNEHLCRSCGQLEATDWCEQHDSWARIAEDTE